ncbi:MAG: DUF4233 domain-containing protein [Propionicimonas sp.]
MRLGPKNPMNSAVLSILVFEAIIFALAVAGMIQVSGVTVPVAFGVGFAAASLALAAAALLKRPIGYPLGWLTQVVAIGFGFLTETMFWLGGAFAVIWVTTFVLGRRLEGLSGLGPPHAGRNPG